MVGPHRRVETAQRPIRTPAFMPSGTPPPGGHGEAMLPESVAADGADILLGNPFHLIAAARGRTGGASRRGFTSS